MTIARDHRSEAGTDEQVLQPAPAVLVVMGVSGSGKTTIGALLAQRLDWAFADGDDFHPPANVANMHSGTPLADADRWPWLRVIATWIDQTRRAGGHGHFDVELGRMGPGMPVQQERWRTGVAPADP